MIVLILLLNDKRPTRNLKGTRLLLDLGMNSLAHTQKTLLV